MGGVLIGSEAVAAGALTEHQLRRWHRPLFRDVYVPKWDAPSLDDRILAAWLWSRRRAVGRCGQTDRTRRAKRSAAAWVSGPQRNTRWRRNHTLQAATGDHRGTNRLRSGSSPAPGGSVGATRCADARHTVFARRRQRAR